jgi:hypothetical protein
MRQLTPQAQRLDERSSRAALCLSETKTLQRYQLTPLSSLPKLNRWQFMQLLQRLDNVGYLYQVKAPLCDGDV